MATDSRIDGMEGILERLAQEQTELRQDMREMRQEIRSTRNTLLMVNFLLWVATIGTMVGFFATQ